MKTWVCPQCGAPALRRLCEGCEAVERAQDAERRSDEAIHVPLPILGGGGGEFAGRLTLSAPPDQEVELDG